jgi:F420-dependent oxidoreductase-like protein
VLFSLCLDLRRAWSDTVQLARQAELAGLARIYVPDHFMPYHPAAAVPGPVHECWTTLSALAVAVTRIGLGTLVLGNTYRHPAVVANMAASLDQVSGGRLLLGLGAGWQENEHLAYGIELEGPASRLDRFEEALQVVSLLLRSEVTSFNGSYYRMDGARCEPAPVQTPLPLLVGGAGERRSIPLAARYADAWHSWTTPPEFRHKSSVLEAACAAAGRAPSDVRRLTGQVVRVLAHGEPLDDDFDIIGSSTFVAERLTAYQEAGVDEFVIRDHAAIPLADAIESVGLLASDVVPALS